MVKINKISILLISFVFGVTILAGCSSTNTTTNNTTNGKTTTTTNGENKSTTTTTNDVAKTDTTGDKIGVPECDEYIQKYEACITSKVPEAQRGMYKSTFEQQRKAFKDAAANPQSKAGLATGCKQAIETAKQAMTSYGCAW